jgi:hypothetical protein
MKTRIMGVAKGGRCQFSRTGNHRQVAGEKLPVKNVPVKNSQISTESKELENSECKRLATSSARLPYGALQALATTL